MGICMLIPVMFCTLMRILDGFKVDYIKGNQDRNSESFRGKEVERFFPRLWDLGFAKVTFLCYSGTFLKSYHQLPLPPRG